MTNLRTITRTLAVVAGLSASALVVSACSGASATPEATPAEWELTEVTPAPSGDIDSFTWSIYAEPFSLDYAYAFDYADNQVLANVCESLLRLNPDYSLSPGLAESAAQPDPNTWVYTIREGVTFHDGTPLTAADVVASMSVSGPTFRLGADRLDHVVTLTMAAASEVSHRLGWGHR